MDASIRVGTARVNRFDGPIGIQHGRALRHELHKAAHSVCRWARGGMALAMLGLLTLLVAPGAQAQAVTPPSPLDDILTKLDSIENRIQGLESTVLSDVTNFLSFRTCLNSGASINLGFGSSWKLGTAALKAGAGINFFGNKVTGDVNTEVDLAVVGAGLDAASTTDTAICVDFLKLSAFIQSQVASSQATTAQAQALLTVPTATAAALSPQALADLDAVIGELGDPVLVAEDVLSLLTAYSGALRPGPVVDAALATAVFDPDTTPALISNIGSEIQGLAASVPLPGPVATQVAQIDQLAAQYAGLAADPLALCNSALSGLLGGSGCPTPPPIDQQTFFGVIGSLGDLPSMVADLDSAVDSLNTVATQIDTTVASVDSAVMTAGATLANIESTVDANTQALTLINDNLFDLVFNRLDNINFFLSDLAAGTNSLNGTLQFLFQRVDGFIAATNPVLDTIQSGIQGIQTTVDSIEGALTTIGDNIDSIIRKVDRVLSKLP